MISFSGRGILLDIEGTISSLSFVRDVLFPYARKRLASSLRNLWNDPAMERIRQELATHHGSIDFDTWTGGPGMPPEHRLAHMRSAIYALMDADAKVSPLKELQGLIWRYGYLDGTLRSHVYGEVPRVLKEWKQRGMDIRIYSSGSIEAQKLFFQHVDIGRTTPADFTGYFTDYYDTTTGPKKEAASYTKIAAAFAMPAQLVLFLSDVTAELDAAREAGMKTGLLLRPENDPVTSAHDHPVLHSFDDVNLL